MAKYARASVVHVEVEPRDRILRVAVRDAGLGGADPVLGSGLLGLKDRAETIGGKMTLQSPRGEGRRCTSRCRSTTRVGNRGVCRRNRGLRPPLPRHGYPARRNGRRAGCFTMAMGSVPPAREPLGTTGRFRPNDARDNRHSQDHVEHQQPCRGGGGRESNPPASSRPHTGFEDRGAHQVP